ncbi:MAG: gliding motility-associated ABC transporter substrate-binding protein GldG [Saprospiraceae bacterium]|nr:gliding motility-associated ABC transporter substrate-binding protein GldG [Saprospiraceae bacterium]MCF8250038.1 gliding motility-associated ABC transporter substrate-binding protein GldG [Saprospiraceae bacterium]MCF8278922.1 gliding motility-associated ABC transporter substrate-binding protein GldG [Bacteroidales bacterium]MCF8311051.1 gliding motility-associated ABC transporter substrate-binding protein GldG [Saprospiraceae bacterium]MCF8439613.1 gliding motility-associated ABC transport
MSKKRNQSLLRLGLIVGIALFANVLGNVFFTHFDLTEDKRFTLSEPTLKMMKNLDAEVYINVMLAGDFNAGFKRLQRSVTEMLDDFKSESGFITYNYTNPGEGTVDEINARRTELAKDGIVPTNLRIKTTEGTEEKFIYPYAKISYKGRTAVVDLLDEEAVGANPDEKLNTSISQLEYKFANAFHKLESGAKEVIAFTMGHGELNERERADLVRSLRAYYEVGTFKLDSATIIPSEVKTLIVAKPKAPFSDRDLFLLDQYVMNGGTVLWLIDPLNVELDSLRNQNSYIARDYPLNINDMLFKYGARVNPDLVLDLQCSKIPMVIDQKGSMDLFPWYYFPVIVPNSNHPLVRNLDGINLYFPSSIDTIKTKTPVKKTILLTTSDHSKLQPNITRLNFEILRYGDEITASFDQKNIPVAVLLEGVFPSFFENRVTTEMQAGLQQIGQEYKAQSAPTRMVVVADGDVARNFVNAKTGQPLALGFNPIDRFTYSNKDFLLNAVEYLRDDVGIIAARGREVKLRLLDTQKAKDEETFWTLLNIGGPLVLLGVFGFVFTWLRKRKYAR